MPRPTFSRPHWSYSALRQFLRCPLQYYFERVARLPSTGTPAAVVLGSAVHVAIAEYHRDLSKGTMATPENYAEKVETEWKRAEAALPVIYRDGEYRDGLIEKAKSLVSIYLREPPPEDIIAVEEPMMTPIVDSAGEILEKPLVAIADLIYGAKVGSVRIAELKTAARPYSDADVQTTLQATCYAHAIEHALGKPASVEFVVLVKTKTPRVQRLTTSRTDEDFGRLGDLVRTIDRIVDAGAYYPVESPMNCSSCQYRAPCKSWRGGSPTTNGREMPRLSVDQVEARC